MKIYINALDGVLVPCIISMVLGIIIFGAWFLDTRISTNNVDCNPFNIPEIAV